MNDRLVRLINIRGLRFFTAVLLFTDDACFTRKIQKIQGTRLVLLEALFLKDADPLAMRSRCSFGVSVCSYEIKNITSNPTIETERNQYASKFKKKWSQRVE
jgi:hypothetical protein